MDENSAQTIDGDIGNDKSVEKTHCRTSASATGGAGYEVEHYYDALALTHLLIGDAMPVLGSEYQVEAVSMQLDSESFVDDLMVTGNANGIQRTVKIACRRNPRIIPSDANTVSLFEVFTKEVLKNWPSISSGSLRLCLAVSGAQTQIGDLSSLSDIARAQKDSDAFYTEMSTSGAHQKQLVSRLEMIETIVGIALSNNKQANAETKDVTWKLLVSLYYIQEAFEGDVAPGITNAINRLRQLVADSEKAHALFYCLKQLAIRGDVRAGRIDLSILRRELHSFGCIGASSKHHLFSGCLMALERSLRVRTESSIPSANHDNPFILDRSSKVKELHELVGFSASNQIVLMYGEPDVGKSALALETIDQIRSDEGVAIVLSLRDIPATPMEFEHYLGCSIKDMFSAAPSGKENVLLVDGMEVLQEHECSVLIDLLECANSSGYTVLMVTRGDALNIVQQYCDRNANNAVVKYEVSVIDDQEVSELLNALPELLPVSIDEKSSWLLRRLGVVEQLMLVLNRGGVLPSDLSSEAVIARLFWVSQVRNDEKAVYSVTPDDREAAMLSIAYGLLGETSSTPSSGPALMQLRSDGLLLPHSYDFAWRTTDQFSSDIIRDYTIACLLFSQGLSILEKSPEIPRWATRAARIYSQARLEKSVIGSGSDLAELWKSVKEEFASLAKTDGVRWNEVLLEGVLHAGWNRDFFEKLTISITEDNLIILEFFDCLKKRYKPNEIKNSLLAIPLFEWVIDHDKFESFFNSHDKVFREYIQLWLEEVALLEVREVSIDELRSTRQGLRESILSITPDYYSADEQIVCISLLGSDADEKCYEVITSYAEEESHRLSPIVENISVGYSLAKHNSRILKRISSLYYIKGEIENRYWSTDFDGGIRNHEPGGWRDPLAAYWRGPFFALLKYDFPVGLELVNEVVDSAVLHRCGLKRNEDGSIYYSESDERVETFDNRLGIELAILDIESRFYLGDASVWAWYRGSSVGPYPCMSALLALEVIMDQFSAVDIPVKPIAEKVLSKATTLASAGLVYGFLVRHLNKVTDELDGYFVCPEVWQLEASRISYEGIFHVQGPDSELVYNSEARKDYMQFVATRLVLSTESPEHFEAVGNKLLENAGGANAPPVIKQHATTFFKDAYKFHPVDEGVLVELHLEEEVEAQLASAREDQERINRMYGLVNKYSLNSDEVPYQNTLLTLVTYEELVQDIDLAKMIEKEVHGDYLGMQKTAITGVAGATLILAETEQRITIELTEWALGKIYDALNYPVRKDDYFGSINPRDANRIAAYALPFALTNRVFSILGSKRRNFRVIRKALLCAATNRFIETRGCLVDGMRRAAPLIFAEPRNMKADAIVLTMIDASIRHSAPLKSNKRTPSKGDIIKCISKNPQIDWITPYLSCALSLLLICTSASELIKQKKSNLIHVLIDAYGNSECCDRHDHDYLSEQLRSKLSSSLFLFDSCTDQDMLTELARVLQMSPSALSQYLRAIQIVATYENEHVSMLSAKWGNLMEISFVCLDNQEEDGKRDYWDSRYDKERLVQEIVPSPSPANNTKDFDAVLKIARGCWIPLNDVFSGIEKWIPYATGLSFCDSALIGFLETTPTDTQIDPGLRWIQELIVDDSGILRDQATEYYLISWMEELREEAGERLGENRHYRKIVDAMAYLGDHRASKLQTLDE